VDFAQLGIRIDSSQAKQAASDLDKLAAVGSKVEKSIVDTENASKKLAKTLDDGGKAALANSRSIDQYVKSLQAVAATNGMGARETKLYELALRGASKAQIAAADSALRMNAAYEKGVGISERLRSGFISAATAAAAAATAAAASVAVMGKNAITALADFKDLSDITGSSVSNISALDRVARETGGSFDTVSTSLTKFNQVLSSATGKDDASRVFKALGLSVKELKELDPAEALRITAVGFSKFSDDGNKARAAQELFGKSIKEVGPFLKELAEKTELVGTKSSDAAEEADKFTKGMATLSANSQDAARSLAKDFLPALNAVLNAYSKGGFIAGLDEFGERAFGWTTNANSKRIKAITADIADLNQEAAGIKFDFFGAKGDIAKEIGQKTSELRAMEKRILLGQYGDTQTSTPAGAPGAPPKPSLIVPPKPTGGGRKDNSAAQEAKAQLAFDLEDIRKAQDALANTISNGEKLLEARRSANLITEASYWEQKRAFLIQNNAAQEDSAQKEIDRLQQEKLAGKDAIDNARKILDAQSKLAKVRENGATAEKLLSYQQSAAAKQLADAYDRAQESAEGYLNTISRSYQREIAGVGQGDKFRTDLAARGAIDDKRQQREAELQGELRRKEITEPVFDQYIAVARDTYNKEIKLYEGRTAKLEELQKSWIAGATEALSNYYDESQQIAKHSADAVGNAFKGLEDQLTNLVTGKKFDAKSLFESIATDFARNGIKEQITGPLAKLAKDALGGGGIGDTISSLLGGGKSAGAAQGALGASGAASATAALAGSASTATLSIGALAVAANAAAAALGTSSISSSLSAANLVGKGGGDALGALISGMGWADGGYTGEGSKYQPAGIVHAGEYVVNAENTKRLGLSFLERLNKRGYADGGFVGSVMGGNLGGGDTTNSSNLEVHNHFAAGTSSETVDQAALKFYRMMKKAQRNT
jgi:lambda family phage tail tape measure protein